jgi:hypothetical protein
MVLFIGWAIGTAWGNIMSFFSKIFKKKSIKEDLTQKAKESLIGHKAYDYNEMHKIFMKYGISVYPEVLKQVYGEENFKKFEDEWDSKRKDENKKNIENAVQQLRNS